MRSEVRKCSIKLGYTDENRKNDRSYFVNSCDHYNYIDDIWNKSVYCVLSNIQQLMMVVIFGVHTSLFHMPYT